MTSQEFVENNHNLLVKYLSMVRDGAAPINSQKEWEEIKKLLDDLRNINDSSYTCVPNLTLDDYC